MKFILQILSLLFMLSIFSPNLYGQSQYSVADSTFEAYMENAWDEIRQSNLSDSIQTVYSEKFYKYYLTNPGNKTAEKAVSQAFMMWGNIGAARKAEIAMAHFDYDSEIWHDFIPYVGNAYGKSNQKTYQDYIVLLSQLREKLTHPKSKSQVLLMLSRYFKGQNQTEELKIAAREMVNLEANKFFVDQGLGFLYEIESLQIGQEAPNFDTRTIQQDSISLSDYKNKIVLLEFWATWCGPCLPEIAHLKSLRSKYPKSDLQIIGISLDSDTKKLKQFLQEREITWPQIIQPKSWNGEIPKLYNVFGIPRTYIIGRDGNIIAKDLLGEELEKEIAKLMNK